MLKSGWFIAIALSIGLVIPSSVLAQTQVATLTSDSPFQLRGANVKPSPGVPTWPVMPGDRVKAGTTPVTLTFRDGSTIVLAPGATATVTLSDRTPLFRLESDSAHYMLTKLDGVKLFALDTSVVPQDLVGDLHLGETRLPAGWWTKGRTGLLIAGIGGATGLTVGLARRNGPPVSPIQAR